MVPSVLTSTAVIPEKCSSAGTSARLRPDRRNAVGIREDWGACPLIAQSPPPSHSTSESGQSLIVTEAISRRKRVNLEVCIETAVARGIPTVKRDSEKRNLGREHCCYF